MMPMLRADDEASAYPTNLWQNANFDRNSVSYFDWNGWSRLCLGKGPRQRVVAYLGQLKDATRRGVKRVAEEKKYT